MDGCRYNLSYHQSVFRAKNRLRGREAQAADRGLDFLKDYREYGGDIHEALYKHIETGFGPIEWLLISSIMSWLIQKLLDYWWNNMKDNLLD